MPLHHPVSDGAIRRNHSMKGLTRVVVDTVLGSLLGAASFFAVDALMSSRAEAQETEERALTVWLRNPELKVAAATPFLFSCEIDDGDADPFEVTVW